MAQMAQIRRTVFDLIAFAPSLRKTAEDAKFLHLLKHRTECGDAHLLGAGKCRTILYMHMIDRG